VSGRVVSCKLSELGGLIAADIDNKRRDLAAAINATAEDSVRPIRRRTPRAFGELSGSAHSVPGKNPKVVLDAPHAAAVEIGSLPHRPDIEALVAWVKLRGMQALHKRDELSKLGPTTPYQAALVGGALSARVVRANALGKGHGEFTPVDAARRVAEAIATNIQRYGTKPHWMVRDSLPDIRLILDFRIRGVLKK
jgi:hypothetical protein